jgi:hypothetical protein
VPDDAAAEDDSSGEQPEDDGAGGDSDDLVESYKRLVSGPLEEMLASQAEILRRALEPAQLQWTEIQAELLRSISEGFQQQLKASGLAEAFEAHQKRFVEPYKAVVDDLINLTSFGDPLAPLLADIAKSTGFVEAMSPLYEELRLDLNRLVPQIDFGAMREGFLRACPPNWRALDRSIALADLFDLTEAGFPTAWVPRASVLEEVLRAAEDERRSVFAGRSDEAIEDCMTVLAEVTSAELNEQVALLVEALTVAGEGRLAAAQALAASVLDTTLRHTFQPQRITGYYKKVKDEIADRHENADMTELRWGLVHVPVIVVLEQFDPTKGEPVPAQFNRHASAHAAGLTQYTPANAVIALALATSLLREAHQTIVDAAT